MSDANVVHIDTLLKEIKEKTSLEDNVKETTTAKFKDKIKASAWIQNNTEKCSGRKYKEIQEIVRNGIGKTIPISSLKTICDVQGIVVDTVTRKKKPKTEEQLFDIDFFVLQLWELATLQRETVEALVNHAHISRATKNTLTETVRRLRIIEQDMVKKIPNHD